MLVRLTEVVNDLASKVNSGTVIAAGPTTTAPVGSGLRSILAWIETEAVTSSSWWHSMAGIVAIALGAFMPHSVVPQQVSDALIAAGGLIVTTDAAGRHVVNATQAKAVAATATAIAAQP